MRSLAQKIDTIAPSFLGFAVSLFPIMSERVYRCGELLLGAVQGGVMVSNLLFGVITMQTFAYYEKYPGDRWPLKTLVGGVWLLELAHTICTMLAIYPMTITYRGLIKDGAPNSLWVSYYFSYTVNAVVQAFYANRLSKCYRKPYLSILCWFLTIGRFVSAIVMTSLEGRWEGEVPKAWGLTIVIGLFVEATVDVIIASSMVYFLVKTRRNSAYERTIRILDKLIAITIPTGLMTCIVAITTAITCITLMECDFFFIPLIFCQAKLYSNSMLASLNSRAMLRDENEKMTRELILRTANNNYSNYVEFSTDIELQMQPDFISDKNSGVENHYARPSPRQKKLLLS